MKVKVNTVFGDGDAGFVRMEADDDDDMYHVYNILEEGDTLEAETVRMVSDERE
jgi:stalled ribosome rescue protein Dom34